ncbi:hypothetical protein HY68_01600 [Streptomyces sp. AcH 505]|uniref:hypothetical protein n=1 Tax=Streptomyces sp. AcH 505 TaxID=352211 RepID=UPI0005923A62|nr:hypothetical protein HY68_01600 [Streptomyces sp. AcH 505]
MATRFYFANATAPYVPPTIRGGFEKTTGAVTGLLAGRPTGTATTIAQAVGATTNPLDVLWGRWISAPAVAAGTISGNIAWITGRVENNAGLNANAYAHVFITAGDTDTVRGTLLANYNGATEFTTTATGNGTTGLPVTSTAIQVGDRLVVEFGYRALGSGSTAYTATMNYGNTGVPDLAAGGTGGTSGPTVLPGWVEFTNGSADGLFAPLIEGLIDNFNGSFDAPKWDNSYGTHTQTGGRAVIDCDAGVYSGYGSVAQWQLTESAVYVQVPTLPAASTSAEAYSNVMVLSGIDGSYIGVLFNRVTNKIRFSNNTAYFDGSAVEITYDPVAHQWVRIRHSGNSVFWDTSPDGTTWTNRRTLTTAPSWVKYQNLTFAMECHRDVGTNDVGEFDNVNTAGSALFTVSAAASLTLAGGTGRASQLPRGSTVSGGGSTLRQTALARQSNVSTVAMARRLAVLTALAVVVTGLGLRRASVLARAAAAAISPGARRSTLLQAMPAVVVGLGTARRGTTLLPLPASGSSTGNVGRRASLPRTAAVTGGAFASQASRFLRLLAASIMTSTKVTRSLTTTMAAACSGTGRIGRALILARTASVTPAAATRRATRLSWSTTVTTTGEAVRSAGRILLLAATVATSNTVARLSVLSRGTVVLLTGGTARLTALRRSAPASGTAQAARSVLLTRSAPVTTTPGSVRAAQLVRAAAATVSAAVGRRIAVTRPGAVGASAASQRRMDAHLAGSVTLAGALRRAGSLVLSAHPAVAGSVARATAVRHSVSVSSASFVARGNAYFRSLDAAVSSSASSTLQLARGILVTAVVSAAPVVSRGTALVSGAAVASAAAARRSTQLAFRTATSIGSLLARAASISRTAPSSTTAATVRSTALSRAAVVLSSGGARRWLALGPVAAATAVSVQLTRLGGIARASSITLVGRTERGSQLRRAAVALAEPDARRSLTQTLVAQVLIVAGAGVSGAARLVLAATVTIGGFVGRRATVLLRGTASVTPTARRRIVTSPLRAVANAFAGVRSGRYYTRALDVAVSLSPALAWLFTPGHFRNLAVSVRGPFVRWSARATESQWAARIRNGRWTIRK